MNILYGQTALFYTIGTNQTLYLMEFSEEKKILVYDLPTTVVLIHSQNSVTGQ